MSNSIMESMVPDRESSDPLVIVPTRPKATDSLEDRFEFGSQPAALVQTDDAPSRADGVAGEIHGSASSSSSLAGIGSTSAVHRHGDVQAAATGSQEAATNDDTRSVRRMTNEPSQWKLP
eukprot:TRINITY_DN70428_c0_g1_i1.p1 TRINITY_DN70428_c0_g1~~TRINITY_DN70428_c0_g1_i1.p1  ORF type:complete len:133 (-),score=28.47 TRINITY_DN70428_c0_g1_i1:28-387(-)